MRCSLARPAGDLLEATAGNGGGRGGARGERLAAPGQISRGISPPGVVHTRAFSGSPTSRAPHCGPLPTTLAPQQPPSHGSRHGQAWPSRRPLAPQPPLANPCPSIPLQELLVHTRKLMVALAESNFYSALGVARKALQDADELGEAVPCCSTV